MNISGMIRPAWTPVTIALMVIGFMIGWPLGVAMLVYIIWGERLELFKRDVNAATDSLLSSFRSASPWKSSSATGNVAFDEWREREIQRLAEERRKLDDMAAEFEAFLRDSRRGGDQDEFKRFMASRATDVSAADVKPVSRRSKSTPRLLDDVQ